MRSSWLGSMQAALLATLSRPSWWAMALAAFLIRGGIAIILLPILSVPSAAAVVTTFSPVVAAIVLGRPSLEGAVVGSSLIAALLAGLAAAGFAGAWLDLALVREATEDDDADIGWRSVHASASEALAVRLGAHVPTLLAIGYAFLRTVTVAYEQFTSPSDEGIQIVDRVLARVPDAVILVLVAWLVGEAVGSLAARRVAAGMRALPALLASVRQVAAPRGLATLAATSVVLLTLLTVFMISVGRAWEHLRGYLLEGADAVHLWAALVLLVATWVLGLAIVGAGLAWRATAWTAEMPPPSRQPALGRP
ncbi:MAG: hypothetical protein ABI620_07640 [Chloroflexota bacterium]